MHHPHLQEVLLWDPRAGYCSPVGTLTVGVRSNAHTHKKDSAHTVRMRARARATVAGAAVAAKVSTHIYSTHKSKHLAKPRVPCSTRNKKWNAIEDGNIQPDTSKATGITQCTRFECSKLMRSRHPSQWCWASKIMVTAAVVGSEPSPSNQHKKLCHQNGKMKGHTGNQIGTKHPTHCTSFLGLGTRRSAS